MYFMTWLCCCICLFGYSITSLNSLSYSRWMASHHFFFLIWLFCIFVCEYHIYFCDAFLLSSQFLTAVPWIFNIFCVVLFEFTYSLMYYVTSLCFFPSVISISFFYLIVFNFISWLCLSLFRNSSQNIGCILWPKCVSFHQ